MFSEYILHCNIESDVYELWDLTVFLSIGIFQNFLQRLCTKILGQNQWIFIKLQSKESFSKNNNKNKKQLRKKLKLNKNGNFLCFML